MSRDIPVGERPLTDDEIAYLNTRGRRADIILNQRMVDEDAFPSDTEEVTWEEEIDAMTVSELKAELEARSLSTSGNKAELQARLYEAGPED